MWNTLRRPALIVATSCLSAWSASGQEVAKLSAAEKRSLRFAPTAESLLAATAELDWPEEKRYALELSLLADEEPEAALRRALDHRPYSERAPLIDAVFRTVVQRDPALACHLFGRYLRGLPRLFRKELYSVFMGRWMETDPDRAREAFLEMARWKRPIGSVGTVAPKDHPKERFEYFAKYIAERDKAFEAPISSIDIFWGMNDDRLDPRYARQHPIKLVEAFESKEAVPYALIWIVYNEAGEHLEHVLPRLPNAELRGQAICATAYNVRSRTRDTIAAIDFLATHIDTLRERGSRMFAGPRGGSVLQSFGPISRNDDLKNVTLPDTEWTKQLPMELRAFVIERSGAGIPPSEWLDWLLQFDDKAAVEAAAGAMAAWVGRDEPRPLETENAMGWLSTLEPCPHRDHAIVGLVRRIIKTHPRRATEWACRIGDEALRDRFVRAAARHWSLKDPEAADPAIRAAPISRDARISLLTRLEW